MNIENDSAPFKLLLAMLGDENSIDPDDVRDELKFELVVLNGALRKLDKDWDFSDIISQLSSDPGPVLAIIPKLKKQIERMTKLRDDFLRKEQEKQRADFLHTAQEYLPAAPAGTAGGSAALRLPSRRGLHHARVSTIVPEEVHPPWGPLKRYSASAHCIRKYGCIQGMAKVPGTIATHRIISGHWNGLPDFPETIHGDPGPPRRLRA